MIVSFQSLIKGFSKFIEIEILENLINEYKDKPSFRFLNIITPEGDLNLDLFYNQIMPFFSDNRKYEFLISRFGNISISKSDLDKIYKLIMEAENNGI